MNGAEHYRQAEGDMEAAFDQPGLRAELLASAQVHATLALAAATALPTIARYMGDSDEITAWSEATGCTPKLAFHPSSAASAAEIVGRHYYRADDQRCTCGWNGHPIDHQDHVAQKLADANVLR